MGRRVGRGFERGLAGCARRAGGRASAVVAALGLLLLTFAAPFVPASFQFASPAFAATLQANAVAVSVAPPVLQGAVSRKVHGAAGTFDLALSQNASTPTVEPRQGSSATIVFTFDKPVTAANAAVTEGIATAGLSTIGGNTVAVALTGVTNAQWVTVTLTDVASADGGTGGAAAVRIGFLLGDVSQNRVVTVADLGQVNAQIAQVVGAGNYLRDVNASGTLTVADKGIANTQITRALVALGNAAPVVNAGADQSITLPATAALGGTASDDGLPSPPGAMTLSWTKVSGPGTVTFDSPASVTTTASFDTAGTYVLRLVASDGSLVSSDDVQVTVGGGELPTLAAPPLDATVATSVADATKFLYTGPNTVQTGVAPGTIVPQRAAVVRGNVFKNDGTALPGVTVTILNHPEFGQTQTRADGRFDMAVNGGGALVVSYTAPGYLPLQRQVNVRWQDYTAAPDVVMTPLDSQVTAIAANAASIQVHQGSPVTDADGTRQATVLFPAGTQATMVMANGATQTLTSLNVRATEYTVGPNGPARMPAALPPSSGYTYAVELSVDEAIAAGATRVDFSQPVVNYVENFLDFPVGTPVPTGYYHRGKGVWVPAPNGRVIGITGVSGGLATVDSVGAGSMPALALADDERQRLATLYPVGTTLWRVPVSHFTPWDYNWPYGPPPGAVPPTGTSVTTDESLRGSCPLAPDASQVTAASVVECETQVLGESVGVVGTPYALHYRSDRVPGRQRALNIKVSGPTALPATLTGIEASVTVAGQKQTFSFPPGPDQGVAVAWNREDAYGRRVQGGQRYSGSIDYLYPAVYQEPDAFASSFARLGTGVGVGADRSASTVRISLPFEGYLEGGYTDARAAGLGGWTLSVHHFYDPVARVLHTGDGRRREAGSLPLVMTRHAGGGTSDDENIPAREAAITAQVITGMRLAAGADGTIYFCEYPRSRIRRIDRDGVISTFAGGTSDFTSDGVPATSVGILCTDLDVAPDGSVLVAEKDRRRIRRIDRDGFIRTIAGTGVQGTITSGVPALQVDVVPYAVAAGPDGTVYFLNNGSLIYRIGADGTIAFASASVGGGLSNVGNDIVVGSDGALYWDTGTGNRIFSFDAYRRGRVVAGVAAQCVREGPCGDGEVATGAFVSPARIAMGPDGSIHFLDRWTWRLRKIDPDGIITTVAGAGLGVQALSADGSPAGRAGVYDDTAGANGGLAVAPDGSVYVARGGVIYRLAPAVPGVASAPLMVASESGREVYLLDRDGRHRETRDALTGALIRSFGYDGAGRLSSITEATGGVDRVTTIQRDAAGDPTAIVGPFGSVTTLSVDANGFLARITHPAGEALQIGSTSSGLIAQMTSARGTTSAYGYDADGRLTSASDGVGGSQALLRIASTGQYEVTRTTALNRATEYEVTEIPGGTERRRIVAPDGTSTAIEQFIPAARTVVTAADGTVVTNVATGDARFGLQAPFTTAASIRLPSGLTLNAMGSRTAVLAVPTDMLSLSSLTATSTINGRTTTSTYTAATRTEVTMTPAGRTLTTVLDALGRVTSRQLGTLAPIAYAYDVRGRLASITEGSGGQGRTYTFSYGAQGFLQSTTDPLGRTVQYARDANGRVVSKTLPGGEVVGLAYDGTGALASITPPGRPAHTFGHDGRGALIAMTPPVIAGSGSTTFAYDADRRLVSLAQPGGEAVTQAYDAAGRLSGRTLVNAGLPGSTHAVGYDSAGRVATITGPGSNAIAYTYDGTLVSGVVSSSGAVSTNVARTYDNAFRLATESINGGSGIALAYDADDLMTQVGDLVIARSTANGLAQSISLGVVSETLMRNGFGEVTGQTIQASGTPVYSATYARDGLGRVVQRQETAGGVTTTYAYTYDARGQLAVVTRDGATVESYTYDGNRNRVGATVSGVTRNATHDAQDRLVNDGATTFVHAAAGWLATRSVAGTTTSYQYDALGNLLKVTLPSGTVVDYQVDALNRRIAKSIGGVVTQRFAYSGTRVIAELDAAGAVVSRFAYAAGSAPAYMVKGGVRYRVVTDRNRSVRLVVNASTGAVAQQMDYDAFGNLVLDTNPGFQPFGFGGALHDQDTGLVRFGARDYDPTTGRWTAKDPIGFGGGGANLYAYAGNDPVNRIDPDGRVDEMEWLDEMWDQIEFMESWLRRLENDVAPNDLVVSGNNVTVNPKSTIGRQVDEVTTYMMRLKSQTRVLAGGLIAVCGAALEALDFGQSVLDAYENDRSLIEQAAYEEQQLRESGVRQAISCVGVICLVTNFDGAGDGILNGLTGGGAM